MVPNAPKWYGTHQNMSLGSNGVDRVRSLRNDSTQLRGTNICSSSERFAPSFVRQLNGPRCTQTVQNEPKHEFRVQWGGSGAFVAKNSDATSWHEHFATKPPDPPHWTLNSCFGVFRTIGCVRCEKFRRIFVARTFELVRTVLHQFCKETKRSQMVLNATKHEFSVQWGRSGAFIAKNSDATSWHELLD